MMLAVAAVLAAVLVTAGCGREDRDARLYGPDAYRIAGDTPPWADPPFKGDQLAWDHQAEKRARLMNEYSRIR